MLESTRELNEELLSAPNAEAILRVFELNSGSFDDVNLATAWNRLGKAYIANSERRAFFQRHDRTLSEMRVRTDAIAHRLPPRNLASVSYGLARLGYRAAHTTMQRIGDAAIGKMGDFKGQEVSNIAWAFAKAGVAAPELFQCIAEVAVPRLPTFKPQELANTAWAFARAGARQPSFFESIATVAIPKLGLFKAQELTNLVWAFATLRIPCEVLFLRVAAESTSRLYEFNSQELGNLAWAFAKADRSMPELFEAIAAEATPRLHEFKPQELSNTAWAFATAGVKSPQLFAALATEAAPRLDDFKTQELANTVWAYATLGIEAPSLFELSATTATPRLQTFRTQEIANTAWAFATFQLEAPALYAAGMREVSERASEFNSQELTNMAWAIARRVPLCQASENAYAMICEQTCARVSEFRPQGMANMAWAFASGNAQGARKLLAVFERELLARNNANVDVFGTFKPQEIANLLWACATAGAEAQGLFEAVARECAPRIPDFEPQDVANTAWAFSVTNQLRPTIASALVVRAIECGHEAFGLEACCQLHQFNMGLQLDWPYLPDPQGTKGAAGPPLAVDAPLLLPPEFASASFAAMAVQSPLVSSQLHRGVSDAIARLGIPHVNELCVSFAGYHCDIAIGPDPAAERAGGEKLPRADDSAGERLPARAQAQAQAPVHAQASRAMARLKSVIIEVNGPFHYTPPPERLPRPASHTKIRHLRKLGWTVLEIPWYEWDVLEGARAKETHILRELVKLAANEQQSAAADASAPADSSAQSAAAAEPLRAGRQRAADTGAEPSAQQSPRGVAAAVPPPAPGVEPQQLGRTDLAAAARGDGWDSAAIDRLLKRLIEEVKGVTPRKGLVLLAHASELARAGRDLGALSAVDWRCPGIGDTIAQRVSEVALGATP